MVNEMEGIEKNGSNTIKKLSPSDNYSIDEKIVNNKNLINR